MGWIYLIGQRNDPNKFKIGVTKGDIEKRIKKLQTGNAEELYVFKRFQTETPFVLEKMLHRHFSTDRMVGEWFSMDDYSVRSFLDICDMYQKSIDALESNPFFKPN